MTKKEKLIDLLAEQLFINKNEINENSYLSEDLGADSYDLVEIILAIEEEFSIEIKDDKVHTLRTVNNILELIN